MRDGGRIDVKSLAGFPEGVFRDIRMPSKNWHPATAAPSGPDRVEAEMLLDGDSSAFVFRIWLRGRYAGMQLARRDCLGQLDWPQLNLSTVRKCRLERLYQRFPVSLDGAGLERAIRSGTVSAPALSMASELLMEMSSAWSGRRITENLHYIEGGEYISAPMCVNVARALWTWGSELSFPDRMYGSPSFTAPMASTRETAFPDFHSAISAVPCVPWLPKDAEYGVVWAGDRSPYPPGYYLCRRNFRYRECWSSLAPYPGAVFSAGEGCAASPVPVRECTGLRKVVEYCRNGADAPESKENQDG